MNKNREKSKEKLIELRKDVLEKEKITSHEKLILKRELAQIKTLIKSLTKHKKIKRIK